MKLELNPLNSEVFEFIQKNGRATRKAISSGLYLEPSQVDLCLQALCSKGFIRRELGTGTGWVPNPAKFSRIWLSKPWRRTA